MTVKEIYADFLDLTKDPIAASNLTLAQAMLGTKPDEAMTVKDAAKYLKVGKNTVYDLVSAGKLTASRFGKGRGTIRIERESLKRIAETSRQEGNNDPGDLFERMRRVKKQR